MFVHCLSQFLFLLAALCRCVLCSFVIVTYFLFLSFPFVFSFNVILILEQIEVRECLLLFGAESFVLQIAIQKLKD